MIPPVIANIKLQKTGHAPLIYGHRGARGEMPENTMPSFHHLIEHGITAVEIDVQNTADAIPIIHHDPQVSLNQARNAEGEWISKAGPKIIESTYSDLAVFDVGTLKLGTDYQGKFPDQAPLSDVSIPTFDEFCILLQSQPDMIANIEIKSYADRVDLGDSPDDLAKSIIEILKKHDVKSQAIISSFDWRVLSACRNIDASIARGHLSYFDRENPPMQPNIFPQSTWMDNANWDGLNDSLPDTIASLNGHVWAPYFEDVTERQIARAKELGLIVNVWTVNDVDDISRMAGLGVDGIITDFPLRAKSILSDLSLTTNTVSS